MAAAGCITAIITSSFDSSLSIDEIIFLVIVLTAASVPHDYVIKIARAHKRSLLELCNYNFSFIKTEALIETCY